MEAKLTIATGIIIRIGTNPTGFIKFSIASRL